MARIWKERFDPAKHSGLPDAVDPLSRHWTAPTLLPHELVFVSVCSFTFRFDSKEQLESVLDFYEHKIVPTSRESESVWGLRGGDHVTLWCQVGFRKCAGLQPGTYTAEIDGDKALKIYVYSLTSHKLMGKMKYRVAGSW